MKTKIALLVLVAAAAWPAAGNAATLHGVVVGRQHGLLLVATPGGLVQAVRGHAAIGSRLAGTRVVGRATRVRIHGVVVQRVGTTVFLSSNRHLLALHTRGLAASPPGPTLGPPTSSIGTGSVVDATVGVKSNGELDEQDETQVGQVSGNLPVQATVTAVGAGTVTLTVNGQSVTVNLPAGLTLPSTLVGQTVTLTVSLGDNGGDDQGGDDGGGGGDD